MPSSTLHNPRISYCIRMTVPLKAIFFYNWNSLVSLSQSFFSSIRLLDALFGFYSRLSSLSFCCFLILICFLCTALAWLIWTFWPSPCLKAHRQGEWRYMYCLFCMCLACKSGNRTFLSFLTCCWLAFDLLFSSYSVYPFFNFLYPFNLFLHSLIAQFIIFSQSIFTISSLLSQLGKFSQGLSRRRQWIYCISWFSFGTERDFHHKATWLIDLWV